MTANRKSLLIITAYRITETGGHGVYTVKAQLDKLDKQVRSIKKYRKEFLRDLASFINKMNLDNMLIVVDLNKHIISNAIKQFAIENGLCDCHEFINSLENKH